MSASNCTSVALPAQGMSFLATGRPFTTSSTGTVFRPGYRADATTVNSALPGLASFTSLPATPTSCLSGQPRGQPGGWLAAEKITSGHGETTDGRGATRQ